MVVHGPQGAWMIGDVQYKLSLDCFTAHDATSETIWVDCLTGRGTTGEARLGQTSSEQVSRVGVIEVSFVISPLAIFFILQKCFSDSLNHVRI